MRDRLIELLESTPTDFEGNRNVGVIADYLLANGVIVPPCKVGDTVYCIFRNRETLEWYIEEKTVYEIAIYESGTHIYISPIIHYCELEFGVRIFLTLEEAEQALKGGAE